MIKYVSKATALHRVRLVQINFDTDHESIYLGIIC